MSGSVFAANDLDHAVHLARQFAREGRYDYFRGQVRDWPLRPSLARLGAQARHEALERLLRFRVWASRREGLSEIAFSPVHATAVAQHYGIPTDFIDVTTSPEIAGFFASGEVVDDETTEPADACIYCFDSVYAIDQWVERHSRFRAPRFISLDVNNLWRLQAQAGAFLYFPFVGFEESVVTDQIRFPAGAGRSPIPRSRAYPENPSALELSLNQFFSREEIREFNEWWTGEGFGSMNFPVSALELFRMEYFDRAPTLMDGWTPNDRARWSTPPVETYFDAVVGRELALPESIDVIGIAEFIALVERIVRDELGQDPEMRSKTLRFGFAAPPPGITDEQNDGVVHALGTAWDGVRSLPCGDASVATAIAHTAALGLVAAHAGGDVEAAVARLFGPPIVVEFQARDKSYSRSVVAETAIRRIARPDIASFLTSKYRADVPTSAEGLLRAVFSPSHLFNFADFSRFFVEQVVPAQTIYRAGARVLLFSPADLDSFGLP